MKRQLVFALIFSLLALSSHAQSPEAQSRYDSVLTYNTQYSESVDGQINSVMSPVTHAVETVIFWSIPITSDKRIPLSSSRSFNGNMELGTNERIVSEDGLLVRIAEDEAGNTSRALIAQGENIRAADGKQININQSNGEIRADEQGLYYTRPGIQIPFVLIWLILGAIIFTVYMGFINIRGFRHALDVVRGKYDDPDDQGEVSHFQALTAALSGTVGVGNIAGVALAVGVGGPGATFWMIVAGLLGMSSKFTEVSLGLMYRNINPDGSVSGGPMYYLDKGMGEKGGFVAILGKVLAVLFAIFCIGGAFGGGNMVQINQATQQLIHVTGGEASILAGKGWIFGTIMAITIGIVIIGGIKSIVKVTDKIVPFMVGIYILAALIVLGYHFSSIPWAFGQIVSGAFSPAAMYGGIIGVLIQGFRRSAFSNEAGVGSASIAHSAAKTDEPISEGIVALLEPFIDTVVICTMTALVIIITGYGEAAGGGDEWAYYGLSSGNVADITITSTAFESVLSFFPVILSIAVILFALSTMVSWSYYGLKSWTYIFGESKTNENIFKIIFCVFTIIGSAVSARSVFNFGDAMIFAMCFPNVLGLFFLMPKVRTALRDYIARVKSGEIVRHG